MITPLWGTGIAPSSTSRRITSQGDVRIDSEGNVRIATVAPLQVIFLRKTSDGDQRVTSTGDRRIMIDGLLGAQYWQTSNVPTDGGQAFDLLYQTNPWQPAAQGGENLFRWAFITVSWSMSATLVVTPSVDGVTNAITLPNGDLLQIVPSTFTLTQQPGNLNRVSQIFPVPLVRRTVRGGLEVARYYLRGERLQLTISSVGPKGVGELMVEGIEVETEPVQKADYPTVTSQ